MQLRLLPKFSSATMKRSISEVSEDVSDGESWEDVRWAVQGKQSKFCVQWEHLSKAQDDAQEIAVSIVQHPEIESWYVGACKDPYDRFFEDPSPHCMRFHCLFPVWLGKKAGQMEKEVFFHCRCVQEALPKCSNAASSKGGEGISPLSIRFVYVCVKWKRSFLEVL